MHRIAGLLRGEQLFMGRFMNPDNGAFQTTLKSEIYVDKSELIAYTNKVIGTEQAFICNSRPRRLENQLQQTCFQRIIVKVVIQKKYLNH